jgi:hypothetical protein
MACTRARNGCVRASNPTRVRTPTRAPSIRVAELPDQLPAALIARRHSAVHWAEIDSAAREIDALLETSRRLADGYQIRDGVAYVDVGAVRGFDKTELLLLGQERAAVSVVRDSGSLTIAADYGSGLDFVKMLRLGGGMPTRVTVPDARLTEVMSKLTAALESSSSSRGA